MADTNATARRFPDLSPQAERHMVEAIRLAEYFGRTFVIQTDGRVIRREAVQPAAATRPLPIKGK